MRASLNQPKAYNSGMKITRAIIPVAGWGTRRLPITKSVEKCMLPVGNRPLVDYVVEDCLKAGITDIYFVVGEGSNQLRQYYTDNQPLNDYLLANGKSDMLPLVALPSSVNFHFVTQPSGGKYGTSLPVALVAKHLPKGESVVVLMGDDFVYNQSGDSETARLIAAAGEGSAMLGVEVSKDQVYRYGVIEKDLNNNFVQIVEKPSVEEAPSNLINVSKYVLDSAVLDLISRHVETEQVGEYHITEPINDYVAAGGKMIVVSAKGEYLDGGSVEGWLHANNVVIGSCK